MPLNSNDRPLDSKDEKRPDRLSNLPAAVEVEDDDRLDFIVTESADEKRDLAGGYTAPASGSASEGIPTEDPASSTADIPIDRRASIYADLIEEEQFAGSVSGDDSNEPVPLTVPPIAQKAPQISVNDQDESMTATGRLRKLNAQELKHIERNLSQSSTYLSDEEKISLMKTIGTERVQPKQSEISLAPTTAPRPTATQQAQHVPIESAVLSRPKVSDRVRGLAYYTGNFVQIVGGQPIHDGDELVINDRHYMLRKKRLSAKTLVMILSPLVAALLFLLGAMFIGGGSGKGHVVGLVFGPDGRPFIQGASVVMPELNVNLTTNGQGWFRTDALPAGSHRVQYVVAGSVVAEDFVTVVANEITQLSLRPAEPIPVESDSPAEQPVSQAPIELKESARVTERATPQRTDQEAETPAVRTKNTKTGTGAIILAANVEGARFEIDGKAVGSGNLTYQKIAPGRRTYTISKGGFEQITGSIDVTAGQTLRLDVNMTPLSRQSETVSPFQRSMQEAAAALDAGKGEEAVALYSAAIESNPSAGEAYVGRAAANRLGRQIDAAFDDFIQAAEVLAVRNDHNAALSAYNSAIEIAPKRPEGYLGRANLLMKRGESIGAVADFETVISLDKRIAAAYAGLGRARLGQGNYERAIKHLKDARSLDANNPVILEDLMRAYFGDNDVKNLRKTWDQYLKTATGPQQQRFTSERSNQALLAIAERDIAGN